MKKIISVVLCTILFPVSVFATSRLGSSGSEVTKIQKRLSAWGYNVGTVDGYYGEKTQKAVKQFQKNNNLTQDGIAGPATLSKMGISSSTSSYESNVNLLARIINGEARGESYTGQVAIAAVVLNRVKHSSFPNSIAGVIYQNGAFTAVSDGQINLAPQESCYKAARDALNGWDPTYGSIYYYNPRTAQNEWIKTRRITVSIGAHVFCV